MTTQHHASITLPRGTLRLTYQINPLATPSSPAQDSVPTSAIKPSLPPYQLDDLLGFAQRINPKRAFLFVSKVLGRHIPVAPSRMRRAFTDLANLVPNNLPTPILVVGMAETAVGLSAGVHQVLQSRYPSALLLNSTRHTQPDSALLTTFSEDHSHASCHLIYQSHDSDIQSQLLATKTLIMVDDEASTGNTCINVVSALQAAGLNELQQVHLTTLVDWSLGHGKLTGLAPDNLIDSQLQGVKLYRHHLLSGAWQWHDTPSADPISMPSVDTIEAGSQPLGDSGDWGRRPTQDSTTGFKGYLSQFKAAFKRFYQLDTFDTSKLPNRILVLGSNEFVWLPFLLAEYLEGCQSKPPRFNQTVKFSALTRSPIALGGAITAMMQFYDNYGLGMTNFVYNVVPSEWDLIVLCIETPADSVDTIWQTLKNVMVVTVAP